MREILFRAKRIDDGKWVEGYYQKRYDLLGNEEHLIFHADSYKVWEYAEVDPETICQYTGLTDKNGNEIWENDILKFDKNSARYDFVKYKFNENSVEADLHENHDIEFSEFVKENEKIGNIFDNPELLQEESDE